MSLLDDSVASITASMAVLQAQPDAIEKVKNALNQAIDALSGTTYPVMGRISESSFGLTGSATNLTFHHRLAHDVVSDMLSALGKDLEDLAVNLAKAAQGVTEADLKAGEDVKSKQAIIDTLTYSGDHSRGAGRWNYDRNHLTDLDRNGAPSGPGSH